jgi:hypothetical protein
MAQSRRNDSQRELATELERALDGDRAEIADDDETLLDRLVAMQDTFDLGHARLRSECWGALRHRTLRRQGPARERTLLHLVRPSEAAEARFTSLSGELIE